MPVEIARGPLFEIVRQRGGCILVYRPVGGIGDAVMILPALTAIKQQAPDELLVVSCVDYIAPVFMHNDCVDYIITYNAAQIGVQEDIKDLAEFRRIGCIDYLLHHPCPAEIYESKYCPHIYKPRQELFAEACDVKFSIDNYNFVLHDDELGIPDEMMLPERYIAVQLRSHERKRDYRFTKWLLRELVHYGKKDDFAVVSIDAECDPGIDGVIPLHHVPLAFLFGVVKKSLITIGPDSAFCHVAGALDVPVFGLFGPTNPHVRLRYRYAYWLPRYRRCRRQYCWYMPCRFRFCLSAYSPARIYRSVKNIIEGVEGNEVEVLGEAGFESAAGEC